MRPLRSQGDDHRVRLVILRRTVICIDADTNQAAGEDVAGKPSGAGARNFLGQLNDLRLVTGLGESDGDIGILLRSDGTWRDSGGRHVKTGDGGFSAGRRRCDADIFGRPTRYRRAAAQSGGKRHDSPLMHATFPPAQDDSSAPQGIVQARYGLPDRAQLGTAQNRRASFADNRVCETGIVAACRV